MSLGVRRATACLLVLTTVVLGLAGCETGAQPVATGATLSAGGDPVILVNLCPGARVTRIDVTNADTSKTVWRIVATTPSARTTYTIGAATPGFTTTVGAGVQIQPRTYYGAFAVSESGSGGNQTAAFQGNQLKHGLVYTSEPQGLADWWNKPISETAFWNGPCRK